MNIFLLILLMMIVTYIPRMVPSLICDKLHFGKRFKKFLELIPYTAMTALILPGVISVDPEHLSVGIVGALVAVLLSLIKKIPVALVVVAAVLADMVIYIFI